jgi:asparagine synthase (glutamine-hydrolysing)
LLRALYLPGAETLLSGVMKLPPAHYLVARRGGDCELVRYWDLRFEIPARAPSLEDASRELDLLLSRVVGEHLLSDVPVGCLLSGGVDSTAVLDMAAAASAQPLSTFTIGFEGEDVPDEREFARLAARRYATRHHEISISSKAFADFLPGYVWHMEEPVCEPPAIALHYVSKLAAEHVKVVLSGEGGDEAFAGYANYAQLGAAERLRRLAGPLARPLGVALGALARPLAQRRLEALSVALREPPARSYTSRTWLTARPFFRELEGLYGEALRDAVDPEWSLAPTREAFARGATGSALNDMLYVDTLTWLPDDLLVKADKTSMASSLELRVPLLDHRVLEFAARLPEALKVAGGRGKLVLRHCFERRLPREILERPKAGFPVPYARWFRSELREELRALLLDGRSVARGWFRRDALERVLRRNAEDGLYSDQVFCLAALEWWQRLFLDGEAPPAPRAPGRE